MTGEPGGDAQGLGGVRAEGTDCGWPVSVLIGTLGLCAGDGGNQGPVLPQTPGDRPSLCFLLVVVLRNSFQVLQEDTTRCRRYIHI